MKYFNKETQLTYGKRSIRVGITRKYNPLFGVDILKNDNNACIYFEIPYIYVWITWRRNVNPENIP